MRSIRWRVAVWTTAGVLVVAAVASMAWYSAAARILRSEFDMRLDNEVRTLATLTRCVGGRVELEFSDELMPEYLAGDSPSYFQIWLQGGAVVERSRSLGDNLLPFPRLESQVSVAANLTLPDGRPGRAMSFSFAVVEGDAADRDDDQTGAQVPELAVPVAVVMVAQSRMALEERIAALRVSVMLVGLGLALGSAFAVTILVSLGLRPLRQLSKEVGALDPRSSLGALQIRGLPSELVPIRSRIDDLLLRMRDALDRERRVAANMAHELRTPVSELLSLTEVAVRWPEGQEQQQQTLATAHAIAHRMRALTEAVLRLQQPQQERLDLQVAEFSLSELVSELLDGGRQSGVVVQASVSAGVMVTSDQVALRIVLSNLIENAREHGVGGAIHCGLERRGNNAEFWIRNPAAGLEVSDLARLGERFWRSDKSRTSGEQPHFGLGLAIANDLCERVGAELSHHLDAGCLEARVRVPLAAVV